ncbi:seipin isoform X2 [Cinclus cinclus]|uniref:seipin isoform X2 n=1 Tax=Cinclus cinclus TaxID=127875 RepID=UPI002E129040
MAPGGFPPPPGLTWGVQVLRGAQVLRRALLRAGLGLSLALLLLWASLFLYGSFYWAYLPAAAVLRPLHLGFRSDCDSPGPELCSFPSANVSLLGEHREKVLLYGQLYRISVELELPESPVNRELGMFMVTLSCYGSGGRTLATAARSAMLHYRSRLLRALHTAAFAGLFLSGFAEQSQTLELELMGRYREDPVGLGAPGGGPGEIWGVPGVSGLVLGYCGGVRWGFSGYFGLSRLGFRGILGIFGGILGGLRWIFWGCFGGGISGIFWGVLGGLRWIFGVPPQYTPTVGAFVEIRSRRVQLYGARLRVHAHFSGLRYLLYHFPLTSAVLGVAGNWTLLALLTLGGYLQWGRGPRRPRPAQDTRSQGGAPGEEGTDLSASPQNSEQPEIVGASEPNEDPALLSATNAPPKEGEGQEKEEEEEEEEGVTATPLPKILDAPSPRQRHVCSSS